jgi:hypothetical protein
MHLGLGCRRVSGPRALLGGVRGNTSRRLSACALLAATMTLYAACPDPARAESPSTWRLVRTANPRGGPDAVSIIKIAEPSRSDSDLAGLMLRCAEGGFDVAIVLVKPFPPRSRPKVKLTALSRTIELQATVLPPGAVIALPGEAAALVHGSWQSSPELGLEVEDGATAIKGAVALAGIGPAVALLMSNCPSR